jgi:hypothetical protein
MNPEKRQKRQSTGARPNLAALEIRPRLAVSGDAEKHGM